MNLNEFLQDQNINLLPQDQHVINVASAVLHLQSNLALDGIASGTAYLNYEDCDPIDFVTMLNYAALTRKNYCEYDYEKGVLHSKIKHIKHLRQEFPHIMLKFAKQLVDMSEALDPHKYNYQHIHDAQNSDKEALDRLRKQLTGTTNYEPWDQNISTHDEPPF